MPRASCQNCGSKLPPKSRFCPECGARIGGSQAETAVQELPPDETGAVPIERIVVQRRLFGVTPPTALFGLGLAAVETVAAHGSARIELAGLRREAGELAGERGHLLRELGEAVYEGNKTATKELKKRVKELDEAIQAKEAEMTNVALAAQERIGKAQLRVQPTEVLPKDEQLPGEAPEPAVPEPMPPPDEGQPPEPARIPEPYPPPDEGDRPQLPNIPEPGPE